MEPVTCKGTTVAESASTSAATIGLHRLERLLEELQQTAAGVVIYDQLAQLFGEWRAVRSAVPWQTLQSGVTHGYTTLLVLLLDELARDSSSENVMRVCARLIRTRDAFPAWLAAQGLQGARAAAPGRTYDDAEAMEAALQGMLARLAQALKAVPPHEQPRPRTPPSEAVTEPEAAPGGGSAETEQQVNSAYRQHLERTHNEIEKVQNNLSHKVREALDQQAKFTSSLKSVRGALEQSMDIKEADRVKQVLLGGISELQRSHLALAENLKSASDYLRLLAADNRKLDGELHKVRILSLTDELTELPNRRAFIRRLDEETGRAERYGTPLVSAIIDLDQFKFINDSYGHAAGDAVLRCYVNQILSIFRHYDTVARYGGEEFCVLLPNTGTDDALRALAKVRRRVAVSGCEYGGMQVPLPTFSAGVALYVPGESPSSLIKRADQALYQAKRRGRNRIEVDGRSALETTGAVL
jgi:diguanylate cyclase